jgi:hypothetical protein
MKLSYIGECIEEDISRVKRDYGIDISREIGNVLSNFVSYWGNKDYQSAKIKFPGIVDRLETHLILRMYSHLSLDGTRRSRSEIEYAIERKDKEGLWKLNNYLNALKKRKPHNPIRQLPEEIPEELL